MTKITYDEAYAKILKKDCIPLFKKEEWIGSRQNKKLVKYWFRDKLGHEFYSAYDNVANGLKYQCNNCSKQSQLNKQKLSRDEYINYNNLFKSEKDIELVTNYINYKNIKQNLKCKCLICEQYFEESIDNLLKKDSHGCINTSKGERIAITLFERYGIDYEYQVHIPKLNLISDFEIKLNNNKIIHLEIDGDQHYEFPNTFHKTYDEFLKAQKRDVIKDEWYKANNNINVHIRYNVGGKNNQDIESILMDIITFKYGICKTKTKNINFNISNLLTKNIKNKKIISYTLDGKFYNIHNSILDAEKELGVDNATISECINGKRKVKRAGLYMFKLFENNYLEQIEPYKQSSAKPVIVSQNGIVIEELKSLQEIVRKYKVPSSSLCRYLNGNGNNPSKDNYDFKYKL